MVLIRESESLNLNTVGLSAKTECIGSAMFQETLIHDASNPQCVMIACRDGHLEISPLFWHKFLPLFGVQIKGSRKTHEFINWF